MMRAAANPARLHTPPRSLARGLFHGASVDLLKKVVAASLSFEGKDGHLSSEGKG